MTERFDRLSALTLLQKTSLLFDRAGHSFMTPFLPKMPVELRRNQCTVDAWEALGFLTGWISALFVQPFRRLDDRKLQGTLAIKI